MNALRTFAPIMQRQQGATLMIMLIIMIIGVTTFLVTALSSSALKSARDQTATDVLVQARDALIGRAVSDAAHPGSLPCPDTTNTGNADSFAGSDCPSYIGRLPWKTLGLPDLRDGNGERLWYALSPTLRDSNAAQPINSDTQGWLSLTGTISLNNVAAIVFAPGAPLCGQSHTTNAANQYLEALNSVSPTSPTSAVVRIASNDCNNSPYNDNLLAITTDQIFQPVEKRIAREVKACLDNYAALSSNKYPWAAPVTNLAYPSTQNTLFGRIPVNPTINTTTSTPIGSSSDPDVVALLNALSSLQTAAANCAFSDTQPMQTALANAGSALLSAIGNITNPPFSSTFISSATSAANAALGSNACNYIENHPLINPVLTNLGSANTALAGMVITTTAPEDASMQPVWPPGCFVTGSGSYWDDWKDLVFYQVADGYRPNGALACGTAPNNTCLSVTGSGNNAAGSGSYRAVVIVARKNIGTPPPSRSPATNFAAYLENGNLLPQGSSISVPAYNTFRPADSNFQTVNDLVQCLDGNVNCK